MKKMKSGSFIKSNFNAYIHTNEYIMEAAHEYKSALECHILSSEAKTLW